MSRGVVFLILFNFFVNSSFCELNSGEELYLKIYNKDDATTEIFNAIQKCKNEGYSRLVIEKGVYHLRRTRAAEKYVPVSNCDNGLKRIIFPIEHFSDFEINGMGSQFVCHGHMLPFQIEDSKNIRLRNFSVDWNYPFYLQAVVTEVFPQQNAFNIKIDEEYDVQVVNNNLLFSDPEMIRVEDRWLQDIIWTNGLIRKQEVSF